MKLTSHLILMTLLVISGTCLAQNDNKSKIIGKWIGHDVGYDMYLDFKADGSAVIDGDYVKYVLKTSTLEVTVEGETEIYNYSFNGPDLKVWGGDLEAPMNFKRVGSATQRADQPKANSQKPEANSKKLDLTLVGKWCYVNVTSTNTGGTSTDQCITVNADGTYEYYSERSMSATTGSTASQNSDAGTWWIEGNRVYYRSQTQGDGSYELVKQNHPKTGDPMIVLDGTAYVTYFKKSPW